MSAFHCQDELAIYRNRNKHHFRKHGRNIIPKVVLISSHHSNKRSILFKVFRELHFTSVLVFLVFFLSAVPTNIGHFSTLLMDDFIENKLHVIRHRPTLNWWFACLIQNASQTSYFIVLCQDKKRNTFLRTKSTFKSRHFNSLCSMISMVEKFLSFKGHN